MADITVTATSVVPGSDAQTLPVVWGETVTAGMSVYKAADGLWYKAQNDGTAIEAGSTKLGIALSGGAVNQPGTVQTGGTITIGATVVVGGVYIVSSAYGGVAPFADISTNRLSILGYAPTTTTLIVNPIATGITHA
jgi:hypothetical protein